MNEKEQAQIQQAKEMFSKLPTALQDFMIVFMKSLSESQGKKQKQMTKTPE